MDEEDKPPDNLRYNGEGKKSYCTNREHAEDSCEAINHNTDKIRIKIRNEIVQSTNLAKPIDLRCTAYPQLQALNLRHELDVYYQPGANQSKKRESSVLTAAVQPTPKSDSVLRHWWKNRSAMELAYDQRQLLEELTRPDGVINGKIRSLVFPRWRARRHLAENLLLQYARVRCLVSVGRDWYPYEM